MEGKSWIRSSREKIQCIPNLTIFQELGWIKDISMQTFTKNITTNKHSLKELLKKVLQEERNWPKRKAKL